MPITRGEFELLQLGSKKACQDIIKERFPEAELESIQGKGQYNELWYVDGYYVAEFWKATVKVPGAAYVLMLKQEDGHTPRDDATHRFCLDRVFPCLQDRTEEQLEELRFSGIERARRRKLGLSSD